MAFSLAAAVFGLLALATYVCADGTGDGTAYSGPGDKDATGFNSCQFGELESRWETYYAALPSDSFNKASDCGRCIAVKGLEAGASGDWVVAKVVDECASCSKGDVDFSSTAFQEITGFAWDRKRIQWKWTDCEGDASASSADENAKSSADEDSNSNDEDDSKSNRKDENAKSSDDDEDVEGDLNGDGKLSPWEKRKLRREQRKAERESSNRKLLSLQA